MLDDILSHPDCNFGFSQFFHCLALFNSKTIRVQVVRLAEMVIALHHRNVLQKEVLLREAVLLGNLKDKSKNKTKIKTLSVCLCPQNSKKTVQIWANETILELMQAQKFFKDFYDDKYLKVKVLLKISTTIISISQFWILVLTKLNFF